MTKENPFAGLQAGDVPLTSLKLDVALFNADSEDVRRLARIIAEETEAERERRRNTDRDFEMYSGGLLGALQGKRQRYVDTLHWDNFFEEEHVYLRCATRANLPEFRVAAFVCKKCNPDNSRAMFLLWGYLLERSFREFESATKNAERRRFDAELSNAKKVALAESARENANKRYGANTNDKKQLVKKEVKELWDKWQNKRENYKNKSKFAKDMLEKYAELENQTVIVRWCTEWEKSRDPATKVSTLRAK